MEGSIDLERDCDGWEGIERASKGRSGECDKCRQYTDDATRSHAPSK